jgi:hypothetical protein
MVPDGQSIMEWNRDARSLGSLDHTRIGSAFNPAGGANQTIVWKADYTWDGGGEVTLYRDTPGGNFNVNGSIWNGVYAEANTTLEIYGGTQPPTGAFNPLYDGAKLDNRLDFDDDGFSDVYIAGGGTMRIGVNFDRMAYRDVVNFVDLVGGGVFDNTTLESQTTGRHFQSLEIGGGTYRVSTAHQTFAGSIAVGPGIFNPALTTSTIDTAGVNLTVTGALDIDDNVTLQKTGSGTLSLNGNGAGATNSVLSIAAGAVNINGNQTISRIEGAGTLHVNGTLGINFGGGTSRIASVTTGASGQIDLKSNKMIVTGQSLASLSGQIASARNGGTWDGNGITTSFASSGTLLTTLAIASNADLEKEMFGDVTLAENDVLIMYTYTGDADLNGFIDGDDFLAIDSGFSANATTYAEGDFDYSGTIDADDYWLIDRNYGAQLAPFPSGLPMGGVSAVPEPSGAVVMLMAASLVARRRRHR